ncbi:hypothetical protein C5167_018830 [Papaver somniferum]|uniref:Fatty acyl-CoA reductase n=1 Tax=Papaver somniferum TaxID=3469 RepID=A0A4Y7IP10_PAPSO|nr:hypothetical protein C5167_018830 [Papaver somniferum]
MESNGMIQSFENKSILVTGSTGFLSKLFVEKLLRVQPNVKQLYLLFRPADASSPTQRLHKDVTGKEVFRLLRKKHGLGFDSFISEKVTPVFGDVSLENLGIKDSEVEKKMHKEIDIVANFAATTNFEERYDVALAVNTTGPKHVMELAKKRAKLYGWLITYAFTKGMGEITIDHLKGNLPVVIVRPTIVTSTYSEPFPGWTEGFKSLDPMVISLGIGMLPCFLGDNESFFNIIPGDMVVNAIIAAMVNHSNNNIFSGDKDRYVYHISISTHKEQTSIIKLLSFAYDYFRENPWRNGDSSEIVKPVFFPTMTSFREHIHTNFVVPKKVS